MNAVNQNNDPEISFQNNVPLLPEADKERKRIREILDNKELKKDQKIQKVVKLIMKDLKKFGSFSVFNNGTGKGNLARFYWLRTGDLLPISKKSDSLSALIYQNYGINPASSHFKYILAGLRHECAMGEQILVYNFSHYEPHERILFFPRTHREMIVATEDGINLKPNGEDGIYVGGTNNFDPFEYLGTDFCGDGSGIEKYLLQNLNCLDDSPQFLNKSEAAFILEILLYFIPFANAMETRPILVVDGPKGSGKSSFLKRFGIALFGQKFSLSLIPRSRRDLETEFANNVLCVFDNVDRQINRSLRDAFAAVTTGGGYTHFQMLAHSWRC